MCVCADGSITVAVRHGSIKLDGDRRRILIVLMIHIRSTIRAGVLTAFLIDGRRTDS
jgi:hypothetical protein